MELHSTVSIRRQYPVSLQFSFTAQSVCTLLACSSAHYSQQRHFICLLWLLQNTVQYSTINVSTGMCHLRKKTEQPEAWN
jgi:thiosulfate reductase cytochrome b subunit